MTTALAVQGGRPLRGSVLLPADAPIGARALILAGLADGESLLTGITERGELASIVAALRSLGVPVDATGDGLRVAGVGLDGLRLPATGTLDCDRSWVGIPLLAGALAPQPFGVRITAHPSLAERDLSGIVGALRSRGAPVAGRGEPPRLPLAIAPLLADEPLHALECDLPAPDTDTKTAALISGLWCHGPTLVSEPLLSADHTERMLLALGAPVQRAGSVVRLDHGPTEPLAPVRWHIPGSAELAAYVAAAATLVEGSRVALRGVAFNPSAAGFFDALRLLGGRYLAISQGDAAGNEPMGELQVAHTRLHGGTMGSEIALRGATTAPAFGLLGVGARRGLCLSDCEAYASAESGFWAALASLFSSFGIPARAQGAGLVVGPDGAKPRAAEVDVEGQPRLGLCAVVLALAAEGRSVIHGSHGILERFPCLMGLLGDLGADIGSEDR